MPVDDNGMVYFTTTLFALIRESLNIKMRPSMSISNQCFHFAFKCSLYLADEMDQADKELRVTLKKLWPLHAKKNLLDLAVPPNTCTFVKSSILFVL